MTSPPKLHVCMNRRINGGLSCAAGGAEALAAALEAEIARRGLNWLVARNACMGRCADGPNLKAAPGGPLLSHCRAQDSARVIDTLLGEWPKP